MGDPYTTDRSRLRRQAYWAVLCGATGHCYGNYPVWPLLKGWDGPAGLGSPGNRDMGHLKALVTSLPWWDLLPDQDHTTITAGFGTYAGADYVTAARAGDGGLVLAYVPSTGTEARKLTVDLSRLSRATMGRWFNPTDGTYTTIAGAPFANAGARDFTTPGDNGTGRNDWVLVLESVPAASKK